MKLMEPLYVSPSVKHPKKMLKQLNKSKLPCRFFVLTLEDGRDQLAIYPAYCLQQPFYRKFPPVIIGLAKDYEEAQDLVLQIVEESLAKTGECNLKEYLFSHLNFDSRFELC